MVSKALASAIHAPPFELAVVEGPSSAGGMIAYSSPTSSVSLANTHQTVVLEYSINGDTWQRLAGGCGTHLPIDLAVDVVRVRRTALEGGAVNLSVQVERASEDKVAAPWKKDNFMKRAPVMIDNMAACVGAAGRWTRFQGAGVLSEAFDKALPELGCHSRLKVTGISNFERYRRALPQGVVPAAGVFVVAIYLAEVPANYTTTPPTYPQMTVQVELGTDANFDAATVGIANSHLYSTAQHLRAGLNFIRLHPDDDGTFGRDTTTAPAWTYAGTGPATKNTTFTHMRILVSGAGGISDFGICGVFQYPGAAAQANVLVNVDDGYVDTMEIANIASSFGFRIATSMITKIAGLGEYMTWEQNRAMSAAGHEIIAHTRTHPPGGLGGMSNDQIDYELGCVDDMVANGLARTADVLALPENHNNARVMARARAKGIRLVRASKPGWIATAQGLDNPLALGSYDVGGKTVAQVLRLLDYAQLMGHTVALYCHRIFAKPIQSMTYSAATGYITVNCNGHGYSNGHFAYHVGAVQTEYEVGGVVENATANSYQIKIGAREAAAATSSNASLRTYSPDFPAANAPPPADTLYWHYSAYVATFREIAERRSAGVLTPVLYATVLERCKPTWAYHGSPGVLRT